MFAQRPVGASIGKRGAGSTAPSLNIASLS
jgi:hypothetical protein